MKSKSVEGRHAELRDGIVTYAQRVGEAAGFDTADILSAIVAASVIFAVRQEIVDELMRAERTIRAQFDAIARNP